MSNYINRLRQGFLNALDKQKNKNEKSESRSSKSDTRSAKKMLKRTRKQSKKEKKASKQNDYGSDYYGSDENYGYGPVEMPQEDEILEY